MEIYKTVEECKKADIVYDDNNYEKYKNDLNVLDNWSDVENKLINTWNSPKIKYKPEIITEYDPKNKLQNLLKTICPKYYKQSKDAVHNSLYYMFYKYKGGFYIRIRDNKLQFYYVHFRNSEYKNPLYNYFKVKESDKHKVSDNPKLWVDTTGMIRTYYKKCKGHAIDFYYYDMKYFLEQLLLQYKISDCDFIISNKDRLAIKKDLTESSEEIVGNIKYPLQNEFKFKEYIPIFSFNWNERYSDIPLPTGDDILRIFQIYIPQNCSSNYEILPIISWSEKKSTAMFRGTFTGISSQIKLNPRLHISRLNNSWKYDNKYNENNKIDGICFLNAGISNKGGFFRPRKEINNPYLEFVDKNYLNNILIDPLTHQQQSYYKYLIYIEGNAAAYRGAFLFSFESVVLWVKPYKCHLWFEPYLEHKKNCIMIEHDLSNLAKEIEWLKKNDKKAKQIAKMGRYLYDTLLTKEPILNYSQYAINFMCS